MKHTKICLLLLLTSACSQLHHGSGGETCLLYPVCSFEREGVESVLYSRILVGTTVGPAPSVAEARAGLVRNAGKEHERDLDDPFVKDRLPFVRFFSWHPGKAIAEWTEQSFIAQGWHVKRDILLVEYTLCGGDWLKVFARDSEEVQVHVCGPMEPVPGDSASNFLSRAITYRFRGVAPKEILGSEYRNQIMIEPSDAAIDREAAAKTQP